MHKDFALGRFGLVSGPDLPDARLAYRTYGSLNAAGDNCILLPSYYTGTHASYEPWIGKGRALDPDRWFIVAVNMFGNGLSSSPSRADPEIRGAAFPSVTIADNVIAQHRLLTDLGVRHIRMIAGWSMGALQAYEWAVRYPGMVSGILPIAGAARCSPHNFVFLEGVKAALRADPGFDDGRYTVPPVRGLRAFGTVYAGWAYSQDFFRNGSYRDVGYRSVNHLIDDWAADHEDMDANNLLAMLDTWQRADVGTAERGGFEGALGQIQARCIVMPSTTDLYFPAADSRIEVNLIPYAELRPLESNLGHIAGRPGIRGAETEQIGEAMHLLLDG
ncbi:alpha/beta fold hydrolase [Arthrobacter sp. HMWF013]|uniref:alpha/beta fold hydrolase n=1 Tax=Arthrobacter sp. HMWF013 TaxID=2056849 RepID=UPI000D3CC52F|nr:alpha/beta fold hydrolase [Arthrobacter sp. HMWF013]PTT62872.1 homoserine acetyltransferase [Arthrobacter sp. HMWF013]